MGLARSVGFWAHQPVDARVVHDGNRISDARVTSGIDFVLTVVAGLYGDKVAKEIQLQLEYDPEPPFNSGSPRSASTELIQTVRLKQTEFIEKRRQRPNRPQHGYSLSHIRAYKHPDSYVIRRHPRFSPCPAIAWITATASRPLHWASTDMSPTGTHMHPLGMLLSQWPSTRRAFFSWFTSR
ncbi:MAG: hypothetical protein ACSLEN_09250 [Candidatus Malihini olakiniferum]